MEDYVAVSNDPDEIEELEQYKAVFRTEELKNTYLSLVPKKPLGYYIFVGTSEHCRQYLHLYLAQAGYAYISPKQSIDKDISYIMLNRNKDLKYDTRFYRIHSINKNLFVFKDMRIRLLSKSALPGYQSLSRYLPRTFNWKKFRYSGGTWIVKIDSLDSCCGRGNTVIDSQKKWDKARKKIIALKNEEKERKKNGMPRLFEGAVVSKYIDNPLTDRRGHKIHFRCYIMVTTWGVIQTADFGLMMTAKLPYKKGDYSNVLIHDTHLKSSPGLLIWDQSIDPRLTQGIRRVCSTLATEIRKFNLKTHPESRYGYNVFGPDIMFDEDYNPWLLEVNTTPIVGDLRREGVEAFESVYSPWVFKYGIEPKLPIKKEPFDNFVTRKWLLHIDTLYVKLAEVSKGNDYEFDDNILTNSPDEMISWLRYIRDHIASSMTKCTLTWKSELILDPSVVVLFLGNNTAKPRQVNRKNGEIVFCNPGDYLTEVNYEIKILPQNPYDLLLIFSS